MRHGNGHSMGLRGTLMGWSATTQRFRHDRETGIPYMLRQVGKLVALLLLLLLAWLMYTANSYAQGCCPVDELVVSVT